MKAIVRILFDNPADGDRKDMELLALRLTDDRDSVCVTADPKEPGWLEVEFSMPTKPQHRAVDQIDSVLRYEIDNRLDSCIGFPRSAAEEARARRKNERRKALRRARKSLGG